MMIAMGVGSIAGALMIGARQQASKGLITLAALGFGVAALLAAAAPTLPLEMAALALLGLASVTFAAGINSGLQLAAAPEMRGRVMALYSIVFMGTTPIGGPLTGWLGESVSPRASLVMAGAAALAVAAGAAFAWRERRVPLDQEVAPVGLLARTRRRGDHALPAREPSAASRR
jgi:MFS family permease